MAAPASPKFAALAGVAAPLLEAAALALVLGEEPEAAAPETETTPLVFGAELWGG